MHSDRNIGIGSQVECVNTSYTSNLRGKSLRRCRFEAEGARGLESFEHNLQQNNSEIWHPRCRSHGESLVKENAVLLQLEHKGSRCSQPRRTVARSGLVSLGETISVPTIPSYRTLLRENKVAKINEGDLHSSILAKEGVVQQVSGNGCRNQEVTTMEVFNNGLVNRNSASSCKVLPSGRISSFWGLQADRWYGELSDESKGLIEASWRRNTESAYSSGWRQWLQWAEVQGVSRHFPDLNDILNYLSYLFSQNKKYRTISSARSMLSSTLSPIDGFPVGKHPMVVRLLKGVYNLRPPNKSIFPVWSVKKVIEMLSSWPQNKQLTLKQLTLKCVMLVALASAKRVSSISNLTVRKGYMELSDSRIIMQPIALEKTSRPGYTARLVVIHSYENATVCPVACIRAYLERTKTLRQGDKLFVAQNKPHRGVTSQTVSRWLKTVIHMSGQKGSGGSTRSVSTSTAISDGVTVEDIMLTADWTGARTFKNYYFKPVPIPDLEKSFIKI